MSAPATPPAPSGEAATISIPPARRRTVSIVFAACLCAASLGIGFAGGRLSAPDTPQFQPGQFGQPPEGFPSDVPTDLPSGLPSPPG